MPPPRPMPSAGSVERHVLADHVVVGVSPRTPEVDDDEFDVLLTAEVDPPRPWVAASIADVASAVERSPAASVALVDVLRANELAPVTVGLAIESMAYSMLQHGAVFRTWLRERPPFAAHARPAGEPVVLERSDHRLDVVLNRPEVHNALDAAMRDALCEAFDLVSLDPTITDVHLRGDGPSFCSGGDLGEFGLATDAGAAHLLRVERSVGRRLHEHAERVTAHLHGACIGAGIELGAFAGRVVAAPDTSIRLPEVAMGLIPGAGGTVSLPRRIGRHRTAYLALSGTPIGDGLACSWGLVDDVAAES